MLERVITLYELCARGLRRCIARNATNDPAIVDAAMERHETIIRAAPDGATDTGESHGEYDATTD